MKVIVTVAIRHEVQFFHLCKDNEEAKAPESKMKNNFIKIA